MRVIIAGGRGWAPDSELWGPLVRDILRLLKATEVVSGACRANGPHERASGADGFGEYQAEVMNLPVTRFYYRRELGRRGGPVRNEEAARYTAAGPGRGAAILLPGDRGTESMFRCAKAASLGVIDLRGLEVRRA